MGISEGGWNDRVLVGKSLAAAHAANLRFENTGRALDVSAIAELQHLGSCDQPVMERQRLRLDRYRIDAIIERNRSRRTRR
jgi:hypothetical protein